MPSPPRTMLAYDNNSEIHVEILMDCKKTILGFYIEPKTIRS
jgi:hypothetical protein